MQHKQQSQAHHKRIKASNKKQSIQKIIKVHTHKKVTKWQAEKENFIEVLKIHAPFSMSNGGPPTAGNCAMRGSVTVK